MRVLVATFGGCLLVGVAASAQSALIAPASTQTQQSPAETPDPPKDVAFCELAKSPQTFDNLRIRITSFVNFGFEDFTLWDPECASRDFNLWLTYGGSLNSGAIYCCPGEGIPRQGRALYPVVDDETLKQFRSLLTKERDTVARATLVGTLLVRKRDPQQLFSGYGHMGCCSLLVIERVERFDPHTRSDLNYNATPSFYEDRKDLQCPGAHFQEGHLKDAAGAMLYGPSYGGGGRWIRLQALADDGSRSWSFNNPDLVALEAIREVRGGGVRSVKRIHTSAGRQVFEWTGDGKITTAIVMRPYWLSFYARSTQVAWVVMDLNSEWCRK